MFQNVKLDLKEGSKLSNEAFIFRNPIVILKLTFSFIHNLSRNFLMNVNSCIMIFS